MFEKIQNLSCWGFKSLNGEWGIYNSLILQLTKFTRYISIRLCIFTRSSKTLNEQRWTIFIGRNKLDVNFESSLDLNYSLTKHKNVILIFFRHLHATSRRLRPRRSSLCAVSAFSVNFPQDRVWQLAQVAAHPQRVNPQRLKTFFWLK